METNTFLEEELIIEEEVETFEPINEGITRIFTDQGDPEVESLYNKWKRRKLDIQPGFQREFVWDSLKSSRLIESALLDIPLPVIYLSEELDEKGNVKTNVIDGQQRLTAFFSFIDGHFPTSRGGLEFRLTGLKVLNIYNRKTYAELPEDIQDKIRETKVRTITFRRESDPNLKFEIFERLNTGSVPLNAQELRNCVFRGKMNDLIKELAAYPDFRFLLRMKGPDKRMKDLELVLRFSAFYHNSYINYKSPIKSFLNTEMDRYQYLSDKDADNLRNAFKNSVSIIKSLLGENAFRRYRKGTENKPNGEWEKQAFNASLFDILMDTFAREDKNLIMQNLDAIREAYINLMVTDDEFIDAIEIGTSEERKVRTRFDKWRAELKSITGNKHREKRIFSLELKQKLYSVNATCGICGNHIVSIDDSAIDHIKQYWLGGKTIPENARLTHRFCNWSRARKE